MSFDFTYEHEIQLFLARFYIKQKTAKFLSYIPEVLLMLDTFLKLNTAYYENGLVITSKEKIREHYFKKGLVFDILAYSPILFHNFFPDSTEIKFIQLLMFFKIFRVQTVLNNFQEMISLDGKQTYVLSILVLAYELIFFIHIIACLWHGWAYYDDTHETWIDLLNIRGEGWFARYAYCLYWASAVIFTIGTNSQDFVQTTSERLLSVLIFLTSAFFYAYTYNRMTDYFKIMNRKEHVQK